MGRLRNIARTTLVTLGMAHLATRLLKRRDSSDGDSPATDDDGVAMPPAYLMYLISGMTSWRVYLKYGATAAREFAALVDRNGGDFRGARRMLDFGCGCGRVARHMPKLTGAEIYGVDCNRRLVAWCAANLAGAYSRNRMNPPLSFEDAYFDVIYLYSVFTHLRIATQAEWLKEFARVVRPGGFALVTFHDEDHAGLKNVGVSRERLLEEKTYIQKGFPEGSNFTATFQSRDFTRELFGGVGFESCEIVPSNETPAGQAIAVLRRPLNPTPSPA